MPKKPRLSVASEGDQHFIVVPTVNAQALHSYLRSCNIQSAHPEPSSGGQESIQLPRRTDPQAIQKLLNKWN